MKYICEPFSCLNVLITLSTIFGSELVWDKPRVICPSFTKPEAAADMVQSITLSMAAACEANYYWKLGWKIFLLEFQLSALWTAKISWYTHTLLTLTWHMTLSRHSWQLQWLCWGLCLLPHWALLALVLQHRLVHLWLPRIYVLPGSSWFAWQHSV